MSQINLEPTGQLQPRNTDYIKINKSTESLTLEFTNIRGNGYAQVWLRQNNLVRRIDTVSLFNVTQLSHTLFFPFEEGAEIGVSLISYGTDVVLRATLSIVGGQSDTAPGVTVPSVELAALESRVTTLETQVSNLTQNTTAPDTSLTARVNSLESSLNITRNDLTTLRNTVQTQGQTITQNHQTLNSRINTVENRITTLEQSTGTSGGVASVIQTLTLSQGANPLNLDSAAYDRVDIVGDRTNTININNMRNTPNERNLIVAALTARRGTTRTYNNVDVWLTDDGAHPATEQRPGFGELLYFSNIHNAVFGQVRTGVQFKYHVNRRGLIGNFPFVEATGTETVSLVGNRRMTLEGSPPRQDSGGYLLGPGRFVVMQSGAHEINTIQIWFSLSSLVTSSHQRIFSIAEGGSRQVASYGLQQTAGGIWELAYRQGTTLTTATLNGTAQANVWYCATVKVSPNTLEVIIRNLANGQQAVTTVSNAAFNDRRQPDSLLRIGGPAGSASPTTATLTANSWVRAVVMYNTQISNAIAEQNASRYL